MKRPAISPWSGIPKCTWRLTGSRCDKLFPARTLLKINILCSGKLRAGCRPARARPQPLGQRWRSFPVMLLATRTQLCMDVCRPPSKRAVSFDSTSKILNINAKNLLPSVWKNRGCIKQIKDQKRITSKQKETCTFTSVIWKTLVACRNGELN